MSGFNFSFSTFYAFWIVYTDFVIRKTLSILESKVE